LIQQKVLTKDAAEAILHFKYLMLHHPSICSSIVRQ